VRPHCGRVNHRTSFYRAVRLLASGKVAVGCQTDADEFYIAPTVLVDVSAESPIMQEEVFGPILPVLEIGSVEAGIQSVNSRPPGLGVFVFAQDAGVAARLLDATVSGTAWLNDYHTHPVSPT